ncbi:unnamed protein product [Brassica oleracea]
MANAAIFLFDLKTGRCSSTIQVRLLCFLEPMNVRWGSKLIGVDMFLLDSQAHAYILTRKPSQGRLLQAGCPRHWACASSSIA